MAVGPKGGLLIPELLGANKLPREWEEIAPFVWREKGGHDLLAAKVENGKVVRWSFGLLGPFMVFDRVPAHRSSSWIMPAASVSLGVLLLTVLFWPIAWFARRKYRATFPLAGTALRAYKWTRWASLAVVLVIVGWVAMIGALFANLENLAGAFDAMLMVLQIVGLIAFIARRRDRRMERLVDLARWSSMDGEDLEHADRGFVVRHALRRVHVQARLDDGELLMSRLKFDVAVETLRLAAAVPDFGVLLRNGRCRVRHVG